MNTQHAPGPASVAGVRARSISVSVIGWLFLAAGIIGLAYHGKDLLKEGPFRYDLVWVCLVRLLAVVGAVFLLRGHNWARWLLVVWMAYHVVLSALRSASEVVVHSLLFGVIAYFLFSAKAAAYFRSPKPEPMPGISEIH
jgi:hypothetical protein